MEGGEQKKEIILKQKEYHAWYRATNLIVSACTMRQF